MNTGLDSIQMLAHLTRTKLVPVLRANSATELERQIDAALQAGLDVIEVTATTPEWARVIETFAASKNSHGAIIGAGTVTTSQTAEQALTAGAQFLVSPYPVPEVRSSLPLATALIEGGMTPGELAAASSHNGLAKLFPAGTVGLGHFASIRDILPRTQFMPTGGITTASAPHWLAAGAVAVGMGGGLFKLEADQIREFHASLKVI